MGIASGSLQTLESIHRRKTGALFVASLRLGGLIAGASGEQFAALDQFGTNIGLAFQITDDLLDHDDDRHGGAKRKGDRGKLTFPNLIGVKQSRLEVERLVKASLHALEAFGSSAISLRALAHFISDRL
jgi:geranylgeranyl pyrophosphate synthase